MLIFINRRNLLFPSAGEALYQLKYKNDFTQVAPLARAVIEHIVPLLPNFGLVIPMPASRARVRQPVTELAGAIANMLGLPTFEDLLVKKASAPPLKDLHDRDAKVAALVGMISLNPCIKAQGCWNALLVDDLYDSGATVDAACQALRTYEKIGEIYVATITWR